MKALKVRQIFTVVREYEVAEPLSEHDSHLLHVEDEAGEFLYGDSRGEEISVQFQVSNDGQNWTPYAPGEANADYQEISSKLTDSEKRLLVEALRMPVSPPSPVSKKLVDMGLLFLYSGVFPKYFLLTDLGKALVIWLQSQDPA